jgi:hypothetical protein
VAEKVAATILVASDGGILPPVLQPTCGWKPLNRQAGKPAATFSDSLLVLKTQFSILRARFLVLSPYFPG